MPKVTCLYDPNPSTAAFLHTHNIRLEIDTDQQKLSCKKYIPMFASTQLNSQNGQTILKKKSFHATDNDTVNKKLSQNNKAILALQPSIDHVLF
jgi:hypothetical protein